MCLGRHCRSGVQGRHPLGRPQLLYPASSGPTWMSARLHHLQRTFQEPADFLSRRPTWSSRDPHLGSVSEGVHSVIMTEGISLSNKAKTSTTVQGRACQNRCQALARAARVRRCLVPSRTPSPIGRPVGRRVREYVGRHGYGGRHAYGGRHVSGRRRCRSYEA